MVFVGIGQKVKTLNAHRSGRQGNRLPVAGAGIGPFAGDLDSGIGRRDLVYDADELCQCPGDFIFIRAAIRFLPPPRPRHHPSRWQSPNAR